MDIKSFSGWCGGPSGGPADYRPGRQSAHFPHRDRPKIGAVACRAHSDRLGFLYLQPHNRAKPQRFQPVSCCVARYHLLPGSIVAQTPRRLQNCLQNATYSIALHKKSARYQRAEYCAVRWKSGRGASDLRPPSRSSRASWLPPRSAGCVRPRRRIPPRVHAAWACLR
jgi:hypothetical protein